MKAMRMIRAERRRQREVEGWKLRHDDGYTNGELAHAAACYAARAGDRFGDRISRDVRHEVPPLWPWGKEWWKPIPNNEPDDRIRELVKAGALIVAEIERLQRLKAANAALSGTGTKD